LLLDRTSGHITSVAASDHTWQLPYTQRLATVEGTGGGGAYSCRTGGRAPVGFGCQTQALAEPMRTLSVPMHWSVGVVAPLPVQQHMCPYMRVSS
jgi:hypothetical protein